MTSRVSRSVLIMSMLASVIFGMFAGNTSFADQDDQLEAMVRHRQALMKSSGEHMRVLAAFVKSDGNAQTEPVHRAVKELKLLAGQMPDMFPPGSSMDSGLNTATGARVEIWADKDDFDTMAQDLVRELDAFKDSVESGDPNALSAQFRELGKQGCSACHQDYREKL